MTAMTSKMCTALPTFGILGLIDPPKKPSSHKISRMTIMVHNMRFLLCENLPGVDGPRRLGARPRYQLLLSLAARRLKAVTRSPDECGCIIRTRSTAKETKPE